MNKSKSKYSHSAKSSPLEGFGEANFIHMKKIYLLSVLFFVFAVSVFSQGINIVPKPVSVEEKQGFFEIGSTTKIYANNAKSEQLAGFLNEFLDENFDISLTVQKKNNAGNGIAFVLDKSFENETYELSVGDKGIVIKGNEAGLFYGLQSLLQLMPVENASSIKLPKVEIKDKPRFGYRGAMLDCGRYFFTPDEVKRFLDQMSYYKLNTFHWHLTEDAGWRIEIKKYPLLTQIGAWRRGTQSGHGAETFDRLPHGGYYTQKQIKEIVKYAQERNITIVPEIDMPGHTLAVLAAYPEVSCTGGSFKVLEQWGIQKDVLCAGNEKTYELIEDVLDELLEMFPSEIIHVGGDEAPKDRWKECPKCQAKMKTEKLNNEDELQSYFIKRIGAYLQSKGRKMLGWDEIMEGGLAPNAMVMSWRGEKGGIEAARMHHEVVMAPTTFMYLDYYQAAPEGEPVNIGGNLPLEKVYGYEPLSTEIPTENQKYVIGVQGNLWMEFIHSATKFEYMAFPRLLAVAEIGWSTSKKDFSDFQQRIGHNLQWLDRKAVNFRIPEPIGLKNIETTDKKIVVDLKAPIENSQIFYTLNGDDPMINGKRYTEPITIDLSAQDSAELKCIVRTATGRVSGTRSAKYTLKK